MKQHSAGNDPSGLAAYEIAAANRSHDARYGFNLAEQSLGYDPWRYPPFVPAVPGYVDGVTTAEQIFAWNARWQEQKLASMGLGANSTPL
jgi:hypothetical protein